MVFEMAAAPANKACSDLAKEFIAKLQAAIDNSDGNQLSDVLFDVEIDGEDVVNEIDIEWYEKMAAKLNQWANQPW